jgi:hypothetical protein
VRRAVGGLRSCGRCQRDGELSFLSGL